MENDRVKVIRKIVFVPFSIGLVIVFDCDNFRFLKLLTYLPSK